VLCAAALLAAQDAGYERYLTGEAADVKRKTTPGLLLSGGGGDVEQAFRWFIEKAGGGDIVVLRASGSDGYNKYIPTLGSVDSVESFVTKTPETVRDRGLVDAIRNAEGLFIAGGDQWNYVRMWKGTAIEDAIHHVYAKGGPVGGSSAGLAVLGQHAFSAEFDTVTSKQALADPFDKRVTVESDFLRFDPLKNIITDSHFSRRDRMGRLLVFLARTEGARGIGIDEATSVLVEKNGMTRVVGKGSAYFVRVEGKVKECKPGAPLSGASYSVYRAPAGGGTFDLKKWSGTGGLAYKLSVEAGEVKPVGDPFVY
jgi:cyanophycinase